MTSAHDAVFVRPARNDDAALLEKHRASSKEESKRYRGSLDHSASVTNEVSFVAGVGDTVLGSATVGEISAQRWHIAHVYVEPAAREVGIGDALMAHVLAELGHMNAQWISAQALPGDRSMKNLFERHGLVAQTITVGKSLSDLSTEEHASQ